MGQKTRNIARRHHIIPRLLLKRFAVDEQVWVLNRTEGRSYRANIQDATCETDYYTVETNGQIAQDSVEQDVLSLIEGKADPIIRDMLESRQLPRDKDWELMANFLAIMYVRGPTLRVMIKRILECASKVGEEYIHSNEERWTSIIGEVSKQTGIGVNIGYEEALRARHELEIYVEIPTSHYVQEMLYIAALFVPVFAEMTPNLEIVGVACDAEYVISDCPIVAVSRSLQPSTGWRWYRNSDADLYFPLSSRACLVLNYDALRKVISVHRKRVAFVNHLMACNSQRMIVSKANDFVWRRENGTTSTSHEELIKFLEQVPKGPAEISLDRKSLQKSLLDAMNELYGFK